MIEDELAVPMHRTLRTTLAAVCIVASLAACSGQKDSDADIQGRVEAQLIDSGLDDAAASCVAKVLVKEVGVDRIKKVDLSESEPGAALDDDIAAAAITANATCKVDITDANG